MHITTFAVDLAKNKFQVHGYDCRGQKVFARTLTRKGFSRFFTHREERSRVVMEACAGAHYWARELIKLGYRAELLPPQHVAALVIGSKNDANDADAIFEAAQRPKIRPVAIKSEAQQDVMALHRVRDRLMKARTALTNEIRGLLGERGVVFPKGAATLRGALPLWLAEQTPGLLRWQIEQLWEEWQQLEQRIKRQDQQLHQVYRHESACGQIGAVEGIGELTATAVVASIGDGCSFHSARQFAAWLGLVPREHSSGQRHQLLGITKRGEGYLRKLFVHGGRSVVQAAGGKTDARSRWIQALVARRGKNKAAVAVANKNARIVWAMLHTGECYRRSVSAAA